MRRRCARNWSGSGRRQQVPERLPARGSRLGGFRRLSAALGVGQKRCELRLRHADAALTLAEPMVFQPTARDQALHETVGHIQPAGYVFDGHQLGESYPGVQGIQVVRFRCSHHTSNHALRGVVPPQPMLCVYRFVSAVRSPSRPSSSVCRIGSFQRRPRAWKRPEGRTDHIVRPERTSLRGKRGGSICWGRMTRWEQASGSGISRPAPLRLSAAPILFSARAGRFPGSMEA
jgi:hypothetical protein